MQDLAVAGVWLAFLVAIARDIRRYLAHRRAHLPKTWRATPRQVQDTHRHLRGLR